MVNSVAVNEDVVESNRRIRKQQARIERFERAGFDVSGLVAELRALELALSDMMHQREGLARLVA